MSKIHRLDIEKARRNGETTPATILEDIEKHVQSGEFEGMLCVVVDKDKRMYLHHTDFAEYEIVGLLEMAKFIIQSYL